MNTTPGESIQRLLIEIEALPEKYRRAVIFVMKHHDVITKMCKEEKKTEEQRRAMIDDAIRRDDMIRLAITLFERAVNG